MKPLLRYPGGKYRAIQELSKHIPQGTTEVCSPFFGGGSFELHMLHNMGIVIHAYDWFVPLTNFWQCVCMDRFKLSAIVQDIHDSKITLPMFKAWQRNLMDINDPYHSAAIFFALNRLSFSGTTLNGSMSKGRPRFTQTSVDRIKAALHVPYVRNAHFKTSIPKHDCLVYADPPYYIRQTLYGERGDSQMRFNHRLLATTLNDRGNFILSYNNCQEIKNLYQQHNIIECSWGYGMSNKQGTELLIISKDIAR